jgi:hypothetical protein
MLLVAEKHPSKDTMKSIMSGSCNCLVCDSQQFTVDNHFAFCGTLAKRGSIDRAGNKQSPSVARMRSSSSRGDGNEGLHNDDTISITKKRTDTTERSWRRWPRGVARPKTYNGTNSENKYPG